MNDQEKLASTTAGGKSQARCGEGRSQRRRIRITIRILARRTFRDRRTLKVDVHFREGVAGF